MGFYQFFTVLICFIYLISPSAFTVQAQVVYSGPESVRETQPFTITCNCSLFANIKWRKSGSITDFESENNFSVSAERKFSYITVVSALPSHTGNYKCSYEVDDYGHNLTVVVGIKLTTHYDGNPCQGNDNRPRPHVQQCVIARPYEGEFKLRCIPQPELTSNLTLAWYKAETSTPNDVKLVSSNNLISFDDGNQVLKFKVVDVNDTGIYQCRVVGKGKESDVNLQPIAFESVEVKVLPWVKDAHKDLTVIEENPIELTCVVFTKVNVTVTWYLNTTEGLVNYTSSAGRIVLQDKNITKNGILQIKNANLTLDRGNYSCTAFSEFGESSTKQSFYVRIKSKYAALWPFLGICAEVIILCTIILIYEKKRDKTELEESDTDQGPETKSSPDHGQDSVRYRK